MTNSLVYTDNTNFHYSQDIKRLALNAGRPMAAEIPNSLPSRSVKKRNVFPETWLWTDTLTG